jgi:hypothetical protein
MQLNLEPHSKNNDDKFFKAYLESRADEFSGRHVISIEAIQSD